jgi:hypothetical protein
MSLRPVVKDGLPEADQKRWPSAAIALLAQCISLLMEASGQSSGGHCCTVWHLNDDRKPKLILVFILLLYSSLQARFQVDRCCTSVLRHRHH